MQKKRKYTKQKLQYVHKKLKHKQLLNRACNKSRRKTSKQACIFTNIKSYVWFFRMVVNYYASSNNLFFALDEAKYILATHCHILWVFKGNFCDDHKTVFVYVPDACNYFDQAVRVLRSMFFSSFQVFEIRSFWEQFKWIWPVMGSTG